MKISVVVPVYRSEECVETLVRAIVATLSKTGKSYEILLVDDGSPDESWSRIRSMADAFDEVTGVSLRRNFGQDNALMAGLSRARGEIVVVMDDDLQHHPQDIPRLIRVIEDGYDVCYARFLDKKQARWKNAGSWFTDKIANVLLGKPRGLYLSAYKAISGDVVREVVKYRGPYPYLDGLLLRVTSNITQIDVEHHERRAGRSTYSLCRSVSVWIKLVTSFSLTPLRMATFVGLTLAMVGLVLAAGFTVERLTDPETPLGWASLIVSVLILGGVQLVSVGLLGEYLGRVFMHINERPQWVVGQVYGSSVTGWDPAETA